MTTYDIIADLCSQKGIAITALEKELGFGRGYIGKLKTKGTSPTAKKLQQIADFFCVSIDYLMTGKNDSESQELNSRDRRDIAKDLDILMEKLESGEDGPTRFNGEPIDDETLVFLRSAMEMSLTKLKQINKEKYNPNKNKK